MRKSLRPKAIFLGLFVALLLNSSLSHAVLIGLEPGSTAASSGGSLSINLVISGLGEFVSPSLGAFDVSVAFDPAVLGFTSYGLGGFLGDAGLFESIDVSSGDIGGAVNVAEVSLLAPATLDTLQPGAFLLATLNFDVLSIAAGQVSELSVITDALLGDAFGQVLPISGFGVAEVRGSESVPLPGTLTLFLAAMLGWSAARRN